MQLISNLKRILLITILLKLNKSKSKSNSLKNKVPCINVIVIFSTYLLIFNIYKYFYRTHSTWSTVSTTISKIFSIGYINYHKLNINYRFPAKVIVQSNFQKIDIKSCLYNELAN